MNERGVSRRTLLKGAVAALGLAAVPVVSSASRAEAAASKNMPWAYTAQDPAAVAKRAYEVFFNGGCAEATWWPLVEALGKDTTNPDMALWNSLPKKQFAFGGSGIKTWGTVCGTLIGAPAFIKAAGGPDQLIDAIMMYYADTPLPTKRVDDAARAGWIPSRGTDGPTVVPMPLENIPSLIAHTQLCHASLSQWMTYTGKKSESADQKDRCAKAASDIAYKMVELMNAWLASGKAQPAAVALDPTVDACATPSCHGLTGEAATKGKMACDSCHDGYTVNHTMP